MEGGRSPQRKNARCEVTLARHILTHTEPSLQGASALTAVPPIIPISVVGSEKHIVNLLQSVDKKRLLGERESLSPFLQAGCGVGTNEIPMPVCEAATRWYRGCETHGWLIQRCSVFPHP
jgi:hypothetical protein